MKTFKQFTEQITYQPLIDGPPLDPHTISGAEVQMRTLATHIRSNFVHIPNSKWLNFRNQILKACELLEQAANTIGENMDGELRNQKSVP
jgi:hypothetical protein